MVARDTRLPEKLKQDAILEAILELRFETTVLSEVLIGKIVQQWEAFQQRRLPAYEFPAQLRELDQNVRFTPTIELAAPDLKAALRVGPFVLSYHRTPPYPGWQEFQPELAKVVKSLFSAAENKLTISRVGLRYINGLTAKNHNIRSLADLDLRLTIANDEISQGANINVTTKFSESMSSLVRIAGTELVKGQLPEDTTVLVDVDVSTNDSFGVTKEEAVLEWINKAHTQEKIEFFHLFRKEHIEQWRLA